MINVAIAGITGWTGKEVARAILKARDLKLVGGVARAAAGEDAGIALGIESIGLPIDSSVADCLKRNPDVLIDYTHPLTVKENTLLSISRGVNVVVGTSGLEASDYDEIAREAEARAVGVIAAGNFSITAALAKHFTLLAAKNLPSWEIIDFAGDAKIDVPSGTVRELTDALGQIKASAQTIPVDRLIGPKELRGGDLAGTRTHSVRLPGHTIGFESHFGLPDERLVIKFDSGTSAAPYVSGTLLAVRRVVATRGLTRGLDTLLFAGTQ